ncbi:MAG: hypothetical protein ACK5Y2_09975 [Bdellovibrionales bacterium]
MNVKGLLGNMITTPIRNNESGPPKVDRSVKSDVTHDRDANGQQFTGEDRRRHESMSEEQLKKAMEYLQNLPSVKESKWSIETILENEKRYVLVKDNLGTLIRRIPESELWTLPFDKDVRTGQLLKKSA